jgi:hypothetical protein
MGLSNWINRYILETSAKDEAAPKPGPDASPEELAKSVELVPTRPASEILGDLPTPDFSGLDLDAVEPDPDPEPEPAPPPEPATDPMDDGEPPPVSVKQVYAAARIAKPEHGFTLEKIAGMLSNPRLANLDETSRANAIAVMLETSGVDLTEVVKDAATRDAALDRFEGFMTDKLITLEVEVDKANQELEAEVERLIARKKEHVAQNKERIEAKERELARFRRVKRAEEQRLFGVIRHFTRENPVSVTQLGSTGPAAPVEDEVSYKDIAAKLKEERSDP